ncbi:endonuclease [Sandaracinobacter neustonicus]|uniref:Endonuclease n=1 Tax=Sandaracinobacter neustonicus TaxID=1715348 RepID=A0A501XGL3_9SPHN|nr:MULTISPECIES: endonuclease/exonuclease/phosphatase family protein [Alphaproteobacteria]TPE59778.1 endonuclease [Sandaracinobacter neustonicus]HBI18252.1 endonuclease [Brevundimonas sp.]
MSNNYAGLRATFRRDKAAGKRCAERLIAMRKSLAPLRKRNSKSSLLLATWNIRDFDSNKFGFGPRLPESFYYLAEIVACFDLVALQEVNRDLSALETLVRILGRDWDYIVTDATEGSGGNEERMAFLYRRDKVWFRKIAGEVVLPEGQLVVSPKTVKPPSDQPDAQPIVTEARQQFARTPFLVAFQAGWFRFSLCTVHIYYGRDSGEQLKRRIAEIERLVEFFAKRQDREAKAEGAGKAQAENYILLGDFNVVSPEHKTMAALKSNGFEVPAPIDGAKVRKDKDHFYDQIAVRVKDPRFRVVTGGMVDMFAEVFRDTDEDRAIYSSLAPKSDPETDPKYKAKTPEALYRKWRTWQMSDHSPLWIEIETDFADDYLQTITTEA